MSIGTAFAGLEGDTRTVTAYFLGGGGLQGHSDSRSYAILVSSGQGTGGESSTIYDYQGQIYSTVPDCSVDSDYRIPRRAGALTG